MTIKQDQREARDREIFALSQAGTSPKVLGQQFGLTTARIYAVIRRGEFYAELDAHKDELMERSAQMRMKVRQIQVKTMLQGAQTVALVSDLLAKGVSPDEIGKTINKSAAEILEMVAPFQDEE